MHQTEEHENTDDRQDSNYIGLYFNVSRSDLLLMSKVEYDKSAFTIAEISNFILVNFKTFWRSFWKVKFTYILFLIV